MTLLKTIILLLAISPLSIKNALEAVKTDPKELIGAWHKIAGTLNPYEKGCLPSIKSTSVTFSMETGYLEALAVCEEEYFYDEPNPNGDGTIISTKEIREKTLAKDVFNPFSAKSKTAVVKVDSGKNGYRAIYLATKDGKHVWFLGKYPSTSSYKDYLKFANFVKNNGFSFAGIERLQ